ncbi:cytidine deaminase [Methanococcoides sp. SA1]|nr:cytidine deaminase [Methanococcoides sp. SA1]
MKTYKLNKEDKEIIKKAKALWKRDYVSQKHSVAAILISKSGEIFEGMSMEFNCGIAVCAERVAIFKMMPKEDEIKKIVAVYKNKVIPPCGVCREIMYEMNIKNLKNAEIIISGTKKTKLKELFPADWQKAF